jgi:hypothetical protein
MQLVIVFTSICSIRKILEIIDDLLIFREKNRGKRGCVLYANEIVRRREIRRAMLSK